MTVGTGEQGWDYTGAELRRCRVQRALAMTVPATARPAMTARDAGRLGLPRRPVWQRPGPAAADPALATGYSGPYGSGPYGSGEYPQAGQGGGRRVSRGRLPGDDDLLPPPRRGAASGGYPAGAGFPEAGSRQGGAGYPDAPHQDAAYPDDAGLSRLGQGRARIRGIRPARIRAGAIRAWGGYPGDSSQPGAGGPGFGLVQPGAFRLHLGAEPGPRDYRSGPPAPGTRVRSAGYPRPGATTDPRVPGPAVTQAPRRPAAGTRPGGLATGDAMPGGSCAGDSTIRTPGPIPARNSPGPTIPPAGDHSSSRTHVAWGRERADEPGEGDW